MYIAEFRLSIYVCLY